MKDKLTEMTRKASIEGAEEHAKEFAKMMEDSIEIRPTPEHSDWKCYLFGGGDEGIVWTPVKGKEPNWFWRTMQYLFFGNRWVRDER